MNEQLELAIRDGIEQEVEEQALVDECRKFLFDGREKPRFTTAMFVCDLNILYDEKHELGREWGKRYSPEIKQIEGQLRAVGSHNRKARAPIKEKLARLNRFAHLPRGLIDVEWFDEQERFREEVTEQWRMRKLHGRAPNEEQLEDMDIHFWELVGDRCYHEISWHWKLSEAADLAYKREMLDDTIIEEADEWTRSVREVRDRAKSRQTIAINESIERMQKERAATACTAAA